MIARGYRFFWCNEAPVFEVVPPHRWKRSFMLRRALHRGQGYLTNPSYNRLTIPTSVAAIPIYTLALPFALFMGQHQFMNTLIRLCDHVGKCLALLGIRPVKETYITE
jgi:hypothetical protein